MSLSHISRRLQPDIHNQIRTAWISSVIFARRTLQTAVEFKLLSVIFLLRAVFEEGYLAEISTSARAVFQGLSFLVAHIHSGDTACEPSCHASQAAGGVQPKVNSSTADICNWSGESR